jgi:putative molybdopterin biosynthesis protein
MQLLKSSAWQDRLSALPGYTPWQSGVVQSLRRVLPWWDFPRKPAQGGPALA